MDAEKKKDSLPVQADFGGGLTAALHSGFGIESPFTREIFLTRQVIVGMRFQGGSGQLVQDLKLGDRVTFVREPENRFDPKAIMALDDRGRKLGYIPRHDNKILAALMDAGKYLYGIYVQRPESMDQYAGNTPPTLFVDLYMREFAMPGTPDFIPRQGSMGSYAVIDLTVFEDDKTDPHILDVCAIRVINGEERGMFAAAAPAGGEADPGKDTDSSTSSDRTGSGHADLARYEQMVRELQQFTGYLPVVIHDASGVKKTALENAWGIYCAKPFSNLVINIHQMAQNHLDRLLDYSLENIGDRLGIVADCGSEGENRCRLIWRIYERFDRSELEKREEVIS